MTGLSFYKILSDFLLTLTEISSRRRADKTRVGKSLRMAVQAIEMNLYDREDEDALKVTREKLIEAWAMMYEKPDAEDYKAAMLTIMDEEELMDLEMKFARIVKYRGH